MMVDFEGCVGFEAIEVREEVGRFRLKIDFAEELDLDPEVERSSTPVASMPFRFASESMSALDSVSKRL